MRNGEILQIYNEDKKIEEFQWFELGIPPALTPCHEYDRIIKNLIAYGFQQIGKGTVIVFLGKSLIQLAC